MAGLNVIACSCIYGRGCHCRVYIPDLVGIRRLLDLESPIQPAFAEVVVLFVAGRSLSWRPSSNRTHLNCAPIQEKPAWNVDNYLISGNYLYDTGLNIVTLTPNSSENSLHY